MIRMIPNYISGSDVALYLCKVAIKVLTENNRISAFALEYRNANVFIRRPKLFQKSVDGF
jgi:hypothetical protein